MKDKIAESFLYHIWDEQHLKKKLQTCDGQKLKILYQGKWNTAAGPDFRNAIILLNSEKFQGDIEIHRTEYDWRNHNHNENPNFNDVILHIVFQNEHNAKFTISESGKKIPILTLENNLDENIEKLWQKYGEKPFDKLQTNSISCLLSESNLTGNEILNILKKLGRKRFQRKCTRFSAELVNSDFNQILYEGIFEALGYSKNKETFLKLAKNITFQKIQGLSNLCKNHKDIFAILAFESGLNIEDFHFDFIDEKLVNYINSKQSKILAETGENVIQKSDWNFFRLRPQNHPICRMWQISRLLFSTLEKSIINQVLAIFNISEKTKIKPKTIQNKFYELLNQNSGSKYKIGKSRCDDIFVNIVLPVCYIYAETLNYQNLKKFIQEIYLSLPKLSKNYITKYISARFKKITSSPKINLCAQQGMMQLYYQFCGQHECKNCVKNYLRKKE